MWELDHKECWVLKNWCFQTVVLEKTLEDPCAAGRLNQSILKGINPEYSFIERTDAEVLILWPPDAKSQLTGKDTDAGKDWRQEEKGMTEDEMVGWHHWLNGHEYDMSGRQWRTEKPGLLQSIVLQRDKTERLNNNLPCAWNCTKEPLLSQTKSTPLFWGRRPLSPSESLAVHMINSRYLYMAKN